MTDLMLTLYEYLISDGCEAFLPRGYRRQTAVLRRREQALLDSLSEEQRKLFWEYEQAQGARNDLTEQALFQAALSMARELWR